MRYVSGNEDGEDAALLECVLKEMEGLSSISRLKSL